MENTNIASLHIRVDNQPHTSYLTTEEVDNFYVFARYIRMPQQHITEILLHTKGVQAQQTP